MVYSWCGGRIYTPPARKPNPFRGWVVHNGANLMSDLMALVTSVGMDDYLSYTIKRNRSLFKKYYVLMSDKDQASEKICAEFDANPIKFDKFFGQIFRFNKSGGINQAQRILHTLYPESWIVILDSDIIVDEKFKDLKTAALNKNVLYGMRRFDAHTYVDYKESRLKRHPSCNGQMVIGYFQMYFDKTKFYPQSSHNASTCDGKFAASFKHNGFLRDMKAIHVGKARIHWNGRSRERLDWPD
jgi:hypothetical protein